MQPETSNGLTGRCAVLCTPRLTPRRLNERIRPSRIRKASNPHPAGRTVRPASFRPRGSAVHSVTVWVLIDADGNAVSDCNPEHLRDEYEADFDGPLDPATPTRIVKLTLSIPL